MAPPRKVPVRPVRDPKDCNAFQNYLKSVHKDFIAHARKRVGGVERFSHNSRVTAHQYLIHDSGQGYHYRAEGDSYALDKRFGGTAPSQKRKRGQEDDEGDDDDLEEEWEDLEGEEEEAEGDEHEREAEDVTPLNRRAVPQPRGAPRAVRRGGGRRAAPRSSTVASVTQIDDRLRRNTKRLRAANGTFVASSDSSSSTPVVNATPPSANTRSRANKKGKGRASGLDTAVAQMTASFGDFGGFRDAPLVRSGTSAAKARGTAVPVASTSKVPIVSEAEIGEYARASWNHRLQGPIIDWMESNAEAGTPIPVPSDFLGSRAPSHA